MKCRKVIAVICLDIDHFVHSLYHAVKDSFSTILQRRQLSLLPVGPASVAQLDAPSNWRPGGRGFNPR